MATPRGPHGTHHPSARRTRPETTQTKGLTQRSPEAVLAQVDIDKLKTSIEGLRADMAELLLAHNETRNGTGFALKQVSVGIEISAEGGVTLIGTLTASAKARP